MSTLEDTPGSVPETSESSLVIFDPDSVQRQDKDDPKQPDQQPRDASSAEAEIATEEDEVHERDDADAEAEAEFADDAEKSTASPCSVPEPEHCSFRTPPPPHQHQQQQQQQQQSSASAEVADSLPQSELLGKLPQEEPQSAASCSSSHSVASVEVERSCMETRGLVSVKWDITRKNKTSIVIDGYKMTESRAGKDGRVFWRCSKRFCSATAISLGQRLLSVRQVDARRFHNHPPTGKEEFFRGDFGSPGVPTQVTIKWPVTRLSVPGSNDPHETPIETAAPSLEPSDSASLSMKRSALLRRRRDRRRQRDEQQIAVSGFEDVAVADNIQGDEEDGESTLHSSGGQYRDSSLLLGSSASFGHVAKRSRHESLEDVASIQQRLTDSLGGVAGLSALNGGGSTPGLMDDGGGGGSSGGLQALAAAAGLHGNYPGSTSSSAVAALRAAVSAGSMATAPPPPQPLMGGLKSMPSGAVGALQHQQLQLQGQLDSQTQKALLALALNGSLTGFGQQPAPQPPPYNPIFNPPPNPQQYPQQAVSAVAANLFSLAAASGSNNNNNNNNNNNCNSSPLKEALSQIDNSQLRRQLRRLEGYFRSGIVSMSEAIFRHSIMHQHPTASSFGSKVASGEQECLARLFNYLEGLERVSKLSHELA